MRTTLSLDDDVAAAIEQIRSARKATFKEIVNQALREGLKQMRSRPQPREPFQTRSVDLGKLRLGSIDNIANIADALAIAEGDAYK